MPDIDFSIPQEYYHYYIISGLTLGAFWCFFGYSIFRFTLVLLGFISGAVVGGALGFELSEGSEVIAIGAAIAGGLLGAGNMFALYLLGVFVIGAALGALLSFSSMTYLSQSPDNTITIIAAVVGGVIAVIFKRFMIILATSLTGAWAVVTGLAYFVKNNFDPFKPDSVFELGENEVYRILIVWLAIAVAGFTVQYIISAKKEEIDEESEPESEPGTHEPETAETPGTDKPPEIVANEEPEPDNTSPDDSINKP